MEPGAVVRVQPASCNPGDRASLPALAGQHHARPTLREAQELLQNKQMEQITLLVRKEHIIVTVVIDVNESQSIVLAPRIDDGRARWERIGELLPYFFLW